MLALYWGSLITGILFALITLIFDDLLDDLVDGALEILQVDGILSAVVIRCAMTFFGAAGILMTRYLVLKPVVVMVFSLVVAIILSTLVYFVYVRPMRRAENSIAFSNSDLTAQMATVLVTIPAVGFGEVLVRVGAGNTNRIAASINGNAIPEGLKVKVLEVRDGVLYVSAINNSKGVG